MWRAYASASHILLCRLCYRINPYRSLWFGLIKRFRSSPSRQPLNATLYRTGCATKRVYGLYPTSISRDGPHDLTIYLVYVTSFPARTSSRDIKNEFLESARVAPPMNVAWRLRCVNMLHPRCYLRSPSWIMHLTRPRYPRINPRRLRRRRARDAAASTSGILPARDIRCCKMIYRTVRARRST